MTLIEKVVYRKQNVAVQSHQQLTSEGAGGAPQAAAKTFEHSNEPLANSIEKRVKRVQHIAAESRLQPLSDGACGHTS